MVVSVSDYNYFELTHPGFFLDLSGFYDGPEGLLIEQEAIDGALSSMASLVNGDIANPSEGRMVGHYWLRDPERAPDAEISAAIVESWKDLENFMTKVGDRFRHVVWAGTGGSSLGPQLIARAHRFQPGGRRIDFLDNCDPETYERVLAHVELSDTLFVIVSKSGRTSETMSALSFIEAECVKRGIDLSERIVALTTPNSALHQKAQNERWLATFPIWEWVGGRTSIFSSVGLLPLMLLGGDHRAFLEGAKLVDTWTYQSPLEENPALTLAASLSDSVDCGWPNLAILPYNDRLELLGRYLQQLIMESIGKEVAIDGESDGKGLTVYGNKGTTDQHAFVQQLREGSDDAVVGFVEVLCDDVTNFHSQLSVDTSDSLSAFLAGTRKALMDVDRYCFTLTLERLDEASLGGLIAFWERVVGFLGALWELNPYDQPGVEAGKIAAKDVLRLQAHLLTAIESGDALTAHGWAMKLEEDEALCFHILRRLAYTGRVSCEGTGKERVFSRV